jgi:tRNA-2-methylthio-N6-dimethylallyladenosine synthase
MDDDVPEAEKDRRFRALEDLQTVVAAEINARLVGETVEVLVETRHAAASAGNPKGGLRGAGHRWKGRSRTNKLVFLDSDEDLRGRQVPVRVEWAGPWSLVGIPTAAGARLAVSIEPRLTAPALRL